MAKIFNVVTVWKSTYESEPDEVEVDSIDEIDLGSYTMNSELSDDELAGVRVYDENDNLVASTIDDDELDDSNEEEDE